MIEIVKAPPFATVQDRGRTRLRAQGVPFSGAMDVEAMVFANLLEGILGAGVAAQHRFDPQAKALGEWLRSRHLDIPEALL